MKVDPPEKASVETLEIDAREIKAMLQVPALPTESFSGATMTLKDGRTLFIREARLDEAPLMLPYVEKLMHIDHDFYDIVGARFYSEILGTKEWSGTYESYNGWMRKGLGLALPSYPWPDQQHELGGAKTYYVTKKYWDSKFKNYVKQMIGADLNFDVPDSVRKANEKMIVPEEVLV